MFEVYTTLDPSTGAGYYCHRLQGTTLESSGIQLLTGTAWTAAAPGSSLDCPALTIALAHPNDEWTAVIGGALVGYIGNGTANCLQFNNVSGTTASGHHLTVYYTSGESPSLTVSVNGAAATALATPSAGGWDTVGSVAATVTLTSGTNTVRIGNPTGWAPAIDGIVVP